MYSHPAGLWQINYPHQWRVQAIADPIDVTFFSDPSAEGIMARIHRIPGNGVYSLEVSASRGLQSLEDQPSLANSLESKARIHFPSSFHLMSFRRATVMGIPAYEATYIQTWRQPNRPDSAHLQVWTVVGSDAYEITADVPKDRWKEKEILLRKIVYSFLPLTIPLPTATPAPRTAPLFTAKEVENLVLSGILPCLIKLNLDLTEKNKRWNTRYLDHEEWLVAVNYWGLIGGKNELLDLGQWRFIERTGAIIPFDGTARSLSDCVR